MTCRNLPMEGTKRYSMLTSWLTELMNLHSATILGLSCTQPKWTQKNFSTMWQVAMIRKCISSFNALKNVSTVVSPTTVQHVWMVIILKALSASRTHRRQLIVWKTNSKQKMFAKNIVARSAKLVTRQETTVWNVQSSTLKIRKELV